MNFDELFPLKVCINLDHRKDRWKVCVEEEFPKLGIIPLRKPGVFIESIEDKYTRGVVGCWMSHYQILQAAYLLNQNVAIFEDDVHLKDNSLDVLNSCAEELTDMDFDIFYGGGNLLKPAHKVTKNLARLGHCQSTIFYCCNKKFIPKLLEYLNPQNISCPVDVVLADTIIPKHNCLISIPMVATQRSSYSDIEGKVVNYESYLNDRYWSNLK